MEARLNDDITHWGRARLCWRGALLAAAAALFSVGVGLSVSALKLSWDQIALGPLLLILVLLGPLTLALASVTLQVTAWAVGRRIGFREGVAVSALGSIAELLPVPGGAMVRGAALLRAGARLAESTWVVTLTAGLTFSMSAVAGSAPLVAGGSVVGYLFLAAGLAGTGVATGWIACRAGLRVALAMIVLRVGSLGLAVIRVSMAFAAISMAVGPIDAALFVIGTTLGQAVSIVPAGLGLGEGLAAALALLIDVPPAAAFVAVALNRILGLVVSGALSLVLLGVPLWRKADGS